jgi:DNA anti-recombination protein RmuC
VQTASYAVIIVEAMTKNWTNERLEERFDRIDQRFSEVDRRFDRIDADFRELRAEMSSRFDSTQRLSIQIGAGMFATMIIGFLSILTQL